MSPRGGYRKGAGRPPGTGTGRATPIMPRPGPARPAAETPVDSGDDTENFGDRATPVLSTPPPRVETAEIDDSEKATVPAPHVDVKELFRMSGAPSSPPVTAFISSTAARQSRRPPRGSALPRLPARARLQAPGPLKTALPKR